jgi:hypothetical protein
MRAARGVDVARFGRNEVEEQFAHLYFTGCVQEDWTSWADLFTDDCRYVEHFWGVLNGRDEVRRWIDPVMLGVPEIYTVLDWYMIDDDKVVWALQNRRDNPDPDGPAYFDFAGLSVAWYAGDGRWAGEEDYWDVRGARTTAEDYAAACRKTGTTEPAAKLTRRHWPAHGPDWARFDGPPRPSWLGRTDIAPITKPRELRALLGRP